METGNGHKTGGAERPLILGDGQTVSVLSRISRLIEIEYVVSALLRPLISPYLMAHPRFALSSRPEYSIAEVHAGIY